MVAEEIIVGCSWGCKRVRIDGVWTDNPELFKISKSHTMCEDCCKEQYPEYYAKMFKKG